MKKIFFGFFIIILHINAYSQGNNTDLMINSVSIVEASTPVGGTGFIELVASNIGQAIPINGVRLQMSVSDEINLSPVELIDSSGVWVITWAEKEDNNMTIILRNANGVMEDWGHYRLYFNFVGETPCEVNKGAISSNGTLMDESNLGDNVPNNNYATGYFTVTEPLPITLAKFDAKNEDCKNVLISWTSLNETNFKGYEVEKSLDGKGYKSIGHIAGKTNTNIKSDYVFNDTQFGKETKAYYRLKCVDLDGSITYSDIRSVNLGCAGNVELEVFPNPASNNLKVEMKGFGKVSTKMAEILNSRGQVVQTISVNTGEVNNINIEALISGMYVLRLIDADGVREKKFVKIN